MMKRNRRGILAAVLVMLLFAIPGFALLLRAFADQAGMHRSVFTVLTLLAIVGVVKILRRLGRSIASTHRGTSATCRLARDHVLDIERLAPEEWRPSSASACPRTDRQLRNDGGG
jgi:heme A synthase